MCGYRNIEFRPTNIRRFSKRVAFKIQISRQNVPDDHDHLHPQIRICSRIVSNWNTTLYVHYVIRTLPLFQTVRD